MTARAGDVRVPAHERIVLDNGLTLLVMPRHEVPLIAFNAVMRGGAADDPAGRAGAASLIAGLLEKGAGRRDAFAFVDTVEGAGGSFHAAAGPESISIRGQFLARDQQLMLELLADSLLRPQLAPAEFSSLRARQIELIKAVKESDPAELLGTYGRALLFGAHPFGRPVAGSEASLAAIQYQDILDYRHGNLGADRLTLVVAGDVDSALLQRTVRRLFSAWPRAARPAPRLPQPSHIPQRRILVVDSPGSAQTYFWIGSVGVDRHDPARAALDLANTLYGGRFTSILNSELRVKSGLSYGARSGFNRGSVPGEFALRSFTSSRETGRALEIALGTLTELQHKVVTAEMLDSARAYLLGQFPLEFETAMDWAAALGELELFGLGTAYIEGYAQQLRAVRLADLDAVIRRAFPTPDSVVIVLIGDFEAIRDQLPAQWVTRYAALAQPDFTATEELPTPARAAAGHA